MNPVFFSDRDLGKSFPRILNEAGIKVEPHADHFADNATDVEWLTSIGVRGWLALTHNKRIRYIPNERDAVMHAGVGLFILIGKVPSKELAQNFINTISRVRNFIEHNPPPFITKIHRPSKVEREKRPDCPGRVELWLSRQQWQLSHL